MEKKMLWDKSMLLKKKKTKTKQKLQKKTGWKKKRLRGEKGDYKLLSVAE